jgi:hypothetical protein
LTTDEGRASHPRKGEEKERCGQGREQKSRKWVEAGLGESLGMLTMRYCTRVKLFK